MRPNEPPETLKQGLRWVGLVTVAVLTGATALAQPIEERKAC